LLTSYKREGKAARQSRPQKASSRSGEVAEFTRPEGLLRFAAVGRGGVRTPPYGAKDTWAVMAKPRAGHARPLQTAVKIYAREGQGREAAVPGQSFHSAERCPINRTQKRPKNRLVRHCGQNAHNSSENMCNFLNKTPLRKGGFFGTIKLCKSVCLELCPEQHWGTCQMTQALCGPDTRTALYAKL
jgi:hypothetical protein